MTGQEPEKKMPKALEAAFAEEKSLSSYVEEECKKHNINHEAVSKEMEDMKMNPEPEVDFHEELKFSVKVSKYIVLDYIYNTRIFIIPETNRL